MNMAIITTYAIHAPIKNDIACSRTFIALTIIISYEIAQVAQFAHCNRHVVIRRTPAAIVLVALDMHFHKVEALGCPVQ